MLEQTYLVVEQLNTSTVIRLQTIKRGIACKVHGLRVSFESCQLNGIGTCHIDHRLLTDGSRVERRLHVEIMTEGNIVLRTCLNADKRQHHRYNPIAFKHVIITTHYYLLLHNCKKIL